MERTHAERGYLYLLEPDGLTFAAPNVGSGPDGVLLIAGAYLFESAIPYVAVSPESFTHLPPAEEGGDARIFFLKVTP